MFRGFNLQVTDGSVFDKYADSGRLLFKRGRTQVQQAISGYLVGQAIEAKRLQDDWFGGVKANVFISHSHRDLDLATSVAGFLLNQFGLHSFIDSYVWNHADELLKEIDNEFCINEGGRTYNYQLRNRSTSHVHMMLNAALSKMIDRTECILFLNTPESISPDTVISGGTFATASPWIYSELLITQLIRKRPPQRMGLESFRKSATANEHLDESFPPFLHEAHLNHLIPLSEVDLLKWGRLQVEGEDALDALYQLKPSMIVK